MSAEKALVIESVIFACIVIELFIFVLILYKAMDACTLFYRRRHDASDTIALKEDLYAREIGYQNHGDEPGGREIGDQRSGAVNAVTAAIHADMSAEQPYDVPIRRNTTTVTTISQSQKELDAAAIQLQNHGRDGSNDKTIPIQTISQDLDLTAVEGHRQYYYENVICGKDFKDPEVAQTRLQNQSPQGSRSKADSVYTSMSQEQINREPDTVVDIHEGNDEKIVATRLRNQNTGDLNGEAVTGRSHAHTSGEPIGVVALPANDYENMVWIQKLEEPDIAETPFQTRSPNSSKDEIAPVYMSRIEAQTSEKPLKVMDIPQHTYENTNFVENLEESDVVEIRLQNQRPVGPTGLSSEGQPQEPTRGENIFLEMLDDSTNGQSNREPDFEAILMRAFMESLAENVEVLQDETKE